MDNFENSLAQYLGLVPISGQTLSAVREAAFDPVVLKENCIRLRAIYTRFVGVDLTPEQALQKMKDRMPIDCCHPFFIDSPHLIPLMIAARDTNAYMTDDGLVSFMFHGPREDRFPVSTLLLCARKGKSRGAKDIGQVIYKKGRILDANMIAIDNFVARVFPDNSYYEPEERVFYPPISSLCADVGGPFTAVAAHVTVPPRQAEQILLPGCERYASMGKLAVKRGGRKKASALNKTKPIDLYI